jgi:hypothetical protein
MKDSHAHEISSALLAIAGAITGLAFVMAWGIMYASCMLHR